MPRRKTLEEFIKQVFDKYREEYSVLGNYKNSATKITMIHNTCGCIYSARPNDIIRPKGSRCPDCHGTPLKTTDEFKQEVFEAEGFKYTVLDEYLNNHTKINMKHNECGYEYTIKPNSFLDGNRCPDCSKSKPLTHAEFVKQVFDLTGDEFTVLGEYVNAVKRLE